jgi:hypothetical protein
MSPNCTVWRPNASIKRDGNNPEKFPDGYIFELDNQEKGEVVKNFDHLQNLRFSPQLPKAFTEKGLYMLATIKNRSTILSGDGAVRLYDHSVEWR